MTHQETLLKYILRLGDNSLILGHRLGEWSSKAPILEEDLALTNMALDLIGRAEALLKYAASVEGKGKTEDDLAYKRDERKFYNFQLLEQPNGDFAHTIVRQLFNSVYELIYYSELLNSKDQTLASIAAKAIKEIKYHLKHASDWTIRLGAGTEESHQRMQTALNDLFMYTGEFFEKDETDDMMHDFGIAPNPESLKSAWTLQISEILNEAELTFPITEYMQTGSKKGIHTEHLGYILTEMQYLQRAYPDAKW